MEGDEKINAPKPTDEYQRIKMLTPEEAAKEVEFVMNVTFGRWTHDERMAYRRLWVKKKAQELRDGTITDTDLFRVPGQIIVLKAGTRQIAEPGEDQLVAALQAKLASLDDPASVINTFLDSIPSKGENK